MSDQTATPDYDEQMAHLVKASFPDIACLRCGHDKLYIISDENSGLPAFVSQDVMHSPLTNWRHPFVSIACARCGHVENFLTGLLEQAEKPIGPSVNG